MVVNEEDLSPEKTMKMVFIRGELRGKEVNWSKKERTLDIIGGVGVKEGWSKYMIIIGGVGDKEGWWS